MKVEKKLLKKRLLSLMLVFTMLFSSISAGAFSTVDVVLNVVVKGAETMEPHSSLLLTSQQ